MRTSMKIDPSIIGLPRLNPALAVSLASLLELGHADRDIDMSVYFMLFCQPNEGQVIPIVGRALPVEKFPNLLPDLTPTDGTLAPAYSTSLDAVAKLRNQLAPGGLLTIAINRSGNVNVCDNSWVAVAPEEPAARLAALLYWLAAQAENGAWRKLASPPRPTDRLPG